MTSSAGAAATEDTEVTRPFGGQVAPLGPPGQGLGWVGAPPASAASVELPLRRFPCRWAAGSCPVPVSRHPASPDPTVPPSHHHTVPVSHHASILLSQHPAPCGRFWKGGGGPISAPVSPLPSLLLEPCHSACPGCSRPSAPPGCCFTQHSPETLRCAGAGEALTPFPAPPPPPPASSCPTF